MHWSKLFIPTLREDPADKESVGHRLLLRAGYVRAQSHLYLGQRALLKIAAIVREEMERIGAQEMRLPALEPAEQAMATIARGLRSYKQLPQIWYGLQTGSINACSFGLDAAWGGPREVFRRVFQRCGLQVIATDSVFVALSGDGQDLIVSCPKCGYAASLQRAAAKAQAARQADPEGDLVCEEFHTPGRKTIAEVAEFTGLPETSQMKSLVIVADGMAVLALVRGDHQLSEIKLAEAVGGAREVRAAHPDEIQKWFGASAGSLGPLGVKNIRIIADEELRGRHNMIAGANKDDYHLRNVTPGKDFSAEFRDLRLVTAGDKCVGCETPVELRKGIELARFSNLGHRYPEAMGLRVQDPAGKDVTPIMGLFDIAIERILSTVAEQNHDGDGMILPASIAPFTLVVTPLSVSDAPVREAAESIYRSCIEQGIDALLDDRDERPGVKFKDADLIGVPWRVVAGKKVSQGFVELVERRTGIRTDIAISEAAGWVNGAAN